MSVVLATKTYMLGDRRISDEDGNHQPISKVFRNRSLMAGVVGDYGCILAVEALVTRHGADSPSMFSYVLNSDSEALVVLNGRIYLVGEKVRELREPATIGSGGQAVLGYLAAIGPPMHIRPDVCRDAIRFSFTLQPSCGDGINVVKAPS